MPRVVGRLARLQRARQATYRWHTMERVPTVDAVEVLAIARLWDPSTKRVAHIRSGENSSGHGPARPDDRINHRIVKLIVKKQPRPGNSLALGTGFFRNALASHVR